MKKIDIILAVVCGLAVGFVAADFLTAGEAELSLAKLFFLLVFLSLVSLACLWATEILSGNFLFIFQAAKHLLVGAFVTVVDLKVFEFLLAMLLFSFPAGSIAAKAISFLFATIVKYLGNKYWAFQKNERENLHKEAFYFFIITLVGLGIDISVFYWLTEISGTAYGFGLSLWLKLSVIIAGASAALWNFAGYKFLVFKK